MKPQTHLKAVLISALFTLILLPVSAYADLPDVGMHPMAGPNFVPNPSAPHDHMRGNPPVHVQDKHPNPPQQAVNHPQANRPAQAQHRAPAVQGYFRRDFNYYGHVRVPFPDQDIDTGFTVPDGYEAVTYNGETFYYNQGNFYQQVGDQLTAIPPVLGAVVDYIPQDYQIVMADGDHYLLIGNGTYFQRVDAGFQVTVPPIPQGS